MKINEGYAIGLNSNTLFRIEEHVYCDAFFENWEIKVDEIIYGDLPLGAITLFQTLDEAKDVLMQIINNYENITIRHTSLLYTIVKGNDFNPRNLHVYKIGVIQENEI